MTSDPQSTDETKREDAKNIFLQVDGKSFRCQCGCNVFHKPCMANQNRYECNACCAQFDAS